MILRRVQTSSQTGEAQDQERQRLFKLIEELVQWENTTNETVLAAGHTMKYGRVGERTCEEHEAESREQEDSSHSTLLVSSLFNPEQLPAFHDPFAGGGVSCHWKLNAWG